MIVVICLLLLSLLAYFIIRDGKPTNSPPGPFENPLGTSVINVVQAEAMRKKFGDIVMVYTGFVRHVLLFDYKTAKEVMGSPDFTERPSCLQMFNLAEKKLAGRVTSVGKQWQHDRLFFLRHLRNLDMGKSHLVDAFKIEGKALVDDIKLYNEEPINFPDSFRTAPLNILWQVVASRRYDLRSREVVSIFSLMKTFEELTYFLFFLPLLFPSLNRLTEFFPKSMFKTHLFTDYVAMMKELVESHVIEHEQEFDPENPKDLIDEYLKAMMEETNNDDTTRMLKKEDLHQIVSDLFDAGSDTVNNMLKWVVFLMARHPSIARKLQRQINRVVPMGRLVSLDDKPNLPYVEAFTTEAWRYSSMTIFNVDHAATRDTTIGGYFVAKDTIATAVNYSVHHNPTYWMDPDNFLPERFIDENDHYRAPKEGFFHFSLGRRECVGELLARTELFLFTAALAQHFDIRAEAGVRLTDDFDNHMTLRMPLDCKLIYKSKDFCNLS